MPRTSRVLGGGVSHSDTEGMGSLYRTDTDGESLLPPAIRNRLYDLFGKIERDFESLYDENLQLRHQLELMNEKLEHATGKKDRESLELLDVTKHAKKTEKSNQISQKLKNTYKSHTSRFVSSFRAPVPACLMRREFRGHRDGVWEVSVSKPDSQIIGTASADQTSRIWWAQNSTCLLQYCGHNGSVNSIRFHPTQDLVLTASGDHTAHIWRAHVNKPLVVENTKANSSEDELEGSEREESEAVLDGDEKVEDIIVRQASMELTGHVGVIIAADWLYDGSQVITSSWDRTANLYEVETGEIINTLTGHDQELTNVCAHSSQNLVVTSSKDTTFRLWDLRDPSMKVNVFQGHTQPVTTAVFAGSDKVVSGSDDRTCKVWDLKNMRSPITTIRTDSAVNRLSVHPLYNRIAIPQDNRHIRIYDINGERILRLPRSNRQCHSRMVCAATWSERESSVCNLYTCGFDRQVLGWNVSMHSKD